MHWTLKILGALVLCLLANSSRGQTVTIPDTELEKAIREALKKPLEPITASNMAGLTALDASYAKRSGGIPICGSKWLEPIRTLAGLETATNLTALNLAGLF